MSSNRSANEGNRSPLRGRVAAALAAVLHHESEEILRLPVQGDGVEEIVAAVTAAVVSRRLQRRQNG